MNIAGSDGKNRCFGNNNELLATYHDNEWGIPAHTDQHLFEMLILEGMQAVSTKKICPSCPTGNWACSILKRAI